MNITICELIDEINLRQQQQSKSCKAIAAKVKASASQPRITTLLRHGFASTAASDATAAAVQPITPTSSPSSNIQHLLKRLWIAHSSQQVSAEQINKFSISKDEYMGVLGMELLQRS